MMEKKIFYVSTYHVISKEVENHIFRHNCIFRYACINKQPALRRYWNYNICVQILYSYSRYTRRLFLGCVLFAACCNIIRTLWETKKEKRFSYRKITYKNLFEGHHHFFDYPPSFLCHLLISYWALSPYPSDVLDEWPL